MESLREAVSFGIKVAQIDVGDNHTLAVMDMVDNDEENEEDVEHVSTKSRIFVWGNNNFCQLGVRDVKKHLIDIPHLLDPEDFNPEVVSVTANSTYSSAIDIEGNVILPISNFSGLDLGQGRL